MASLNHHVDCGPDRRIRINECEGEFSIIEQERVEHHLQWVNKHQPIMLNSEQAAQLASRINDVLNR